MIERQVRRPVGDLERGGGFEIKRCWQGKAAACGDIRLGRKAALSGVGRDPVADPEPGHIFPEGDDGSRHLHPEGEGERGFFLIAPVDHQKVRKVQRTGRNPQAQLATGGRGQGDLAQGWRDVKGFEL